MGRGAAQQTEQAAVMGAQALRRGLGSRRVAQRVALDTEFNAQLGRRKAGPRAARVALGGLLKERGDLLVATLGTTPFYRDNFRLEFLELGPALTVQTATGQARIGLGAQRRREADAAWEPVAVLAQAESTEWTVARAVALDDEALAALLSDVDAAERDAPSWHEALDAVRATLATVTVAAGPR